MPKRLETAKERMQFAKRTAASKEVNAILEEIAKLQEQWGKSPEGSQEKDYLRRKVSELRNKLQSVVQQTGGELAYEDLYRNNPLMRNLKLDISQFGIPGGEEIKYPTPEQRQNMSEEEQRDAESKAINAQGDVVDFAKKRIPEEIQRTQQKRQEREEQARVEKAEQKAEQLRVEKEKQRVEEQKSDRVKRDLVENPVWANLTDKTNILRSNGRPGKLTPTEERVIMSMLKTAPTEIESDERFDEFMNDLLGVVEQSRDLKSFNFKEGSITKTAADIPEEIKSLFEQIRDEEITNIELRDAWDEEADKWYSREKKWWDNFERLIQSKTRVGRLSEEGIKRLLEKGFIKQTPAISPGQEPKYEPTQAWIDYLKNKSVEGRGKLLIELFIRTRTKAERKKREDEEDPNRSGPPVGVTEKSIAEDIARNLTSGIKQLVGSKYPEVNLSGSGYASMPEMNWQSPEVREEKNKFHELKNELIELDKELLGEDSFEDPNDPDYTIKEVTDDRKQEIENRKQEIEKELNELNYPRKTTPLFKDYFPELDRNNEKDPKIEAEEKDKIQGALISPALKKYLEETSGYSFKERGPRKTVRDDQNMDPERYEAFKEVIRGYGNVVGTLDELIANGHGDLKFGTSVNNPKGVSIENLLKGEIPGHQWIKLWMKKTYNKEDGDPFLQEELPTNSEAKSILDAATDKVMMQEYLEPDGRGMQVLQKEDSKFSELALLAQFKKSGYAENKISEGTRGRQLDEIKNEVEIRKKLSETDELFQVDLYAWITSVDVDKTKDNPNAPLTYNQKMMAETWYTYDWWFKNVYYGPEKNLTERSKTIDDPGEAEKRFERKLNAAAAKGTPEDLYDFDFLDFEKAEPFLKNKFEGYSHSKLITQHKMSKKMLLGDMIANFMKYDPETVTWLKEKSPQNRDAAAGQWDKNPLLGHLPDFANVLWAFLQTQFARNNASGLDYLENRIQSEQNAGGDPAVAVRYFIKSQGYWAYLTEIRKQLYLDRNITKFELDKDLNAAKFLNSEQANEDPEEGETAQLVKQNFAEKFGDGVSDNESFENSLTTDDLIEILTSSQGIKGLSGMDKLIRSLDEGNRKLWSFLYGEGSTEDIWSDNGMNRGKKLRLNDAVLLWEKQTGKKTTPEAFAKAKERLMAYVINTIKEKVENDPEFDDDIAIYVKIMQDEKDANEKLQNMGDSVDQSENRNTQSDPSSPPEESGLEEFIDPISVNEQTNDDQLSRVEKMRKRLPKEEV